MGAFFLEIESSQDGGWDFQVWKAKKLGSKNVFFLITSNRKFWENYKGGHPKMCFFNKGIPLKIPEKFSFRNEHRRSLTQVGLAQWNDACRSNEAALTDSLDVDGFSMLVAC